MSSRRVYRHFCMMARALELAGERWSLLIVRELLLGPRRFTDLERGLGGITPTRLTARLRQLEAAGLVTRQPPSTGRGYALSEAGAGLQPAVEALTFWGIENALEEPDPDEPAHPEPVMIGSKVFVERYARELPGDAVWVWRFAEDESFTIRSDGGVWSLARGGTEDADVVVETTPLAWARFLTSRTSRELPRADVRLSGDSASLAAFAQAFAAELRLAGA